jgi:predicted phage gp36 major capsid-like protein
MPLARHFPCLAAALLGTAMGAAAQQIYKHVLPDGRIIYSDQPQEPGAAKSKAVELPAPPSQNAKEMARQRADDNKQKRQELEQRLRAKRDQLEAADRSLEAARKALADAEANLERGRESQPGDRTGTVGAGTRLNDRYFERQAENERAVAEARKALEEAQRARAEAR